MNKNITIGVGVLLAFIFNGWFWHTHYLQSPIKTLEFQCMVCSGKVVPVTGIPKKPTVAPKKASESVKPTVVPSKDYVWDKRIENLYRMIRTMESSNGTNTNPVALHNKCKAKGMINEIGYLATPDYCFDDVEHQKLTFSRWIMKREKMTDAQLMCLWNTGTIVNSCRYSIIAEQI
jgi:hypothetical protein